MIEHLEWIYDRLVNVHGEREEYDYMIKLREIIEMLKAFRDFSEIGVAHG